MIECPFCGETYKADKLVYEFNWGELATYLYNRKLMSTEPRNEFKARSIYVTMRYNWYGNPQLASFSTSVNYEKHPGEDPLRSRENGWNEMAHFLYGRRIFEVECDDDDRSIPTGAKILPLAKLSQKKKTQTLEGVSTGIFCPICEQQLKPKVLKADKEIRIVLSGRPGSGKTVYVTQVISELMQGKHAKSFNIEAANESVQAHYNNNKNRLKAFGDGFILATNPGETQQPYIFMLTNDKNDSSVRLVIQDIAGEDTENRTKYSKAVRNADMILFFIDPWHIEEIRAFHKKNNDSSNAIVDRSTKGKYQDLNGVFQQMLNLVDRKFTNGRKQLAGMMLIKGDYLNPPMLSQGNQPECQMMSRNIPFDNADDMEFSISMRSSFIRQCMFEWESTRGFAREVESKYSAGNTRYFVATSLGQSTYLRPTNRYRARARDKEFDPENPDTQFAMPDSYPYQKPDDKWDFDEQMLESAAQPENVIDPIFWCIKRKGIAF